MRNTILLLMVLVGLAAVPGAASEGLRIEPIPSPAGRDSLTPSLVSSGDGPAFAKATAGKLYLSWLEPAETGTGHALRFSVWDGTRFSPAKTIRASDAFFANWADFASMAVLDDGRLAAHWLEKTGEGSYEYDVLLSLSSDGGASWTDPVRPHRDGTLSEHGFVSLVPYRGTGLAAVWLDGRRFREGVEDDEMSLYFTTVEGEEGRLGPEARLDGRVCECCQTTMARTRDGLFVAYRDRSPEEIRDISFVRFADGRWTDPAPLNEDGWHITGCPVNGPQADARVDGEDFLAVAWFTASGGEPRVQVKLSQDGGRSFGAPVRVDDGKPVGRVDVVAVPGGALVSWIERASGRRGEVRARRVDASGAGPSVVAGSTGSGRASGFPRMAAFGGDVYVAWTEAESRGGPSRVRLARARGFPRAR